MHIAGQFDILGISQDIGKENGGFYMIHIYFGDGKGKTTAATGLAVRAAGAGMRVLFTQFLKSGASSERAVLQKIEAITLTPCPQSLPFTFQMGPEEFARYKKDYGALLERCFSSQTLAENDMVVLDEVFSLIDCGMLTEEKLLGFLRAVPEDKEFVLTGHKVSPRFIELCDYASEIKKISHPYDKGAAARRGIEY